MSNVVESPGEDALSASRIAAADSTHGDLQLHNKATQWQVREPPNISVVTVT